MGYKGRICPDICNRIIISIIYYMSNNFLKKKVVVFSENASELTFLVVTTLILNDLHFGIDKLILIFTKVYIHFKEKVAKRKTSLRYV